MDVCKSQQLEVLDLFREWALSGHAADLVKIDANNCCIIPAEQL